MLAPSTPQEMLDVTMLAFDLAFAYRHPVVILGDGYLGQMTGKVELPKTFVKPGLPAWSVWGDAPHRGNLNCSIFLSEPDLEAHNEHLNRKYDAMRRDEARADLAASQARYAEAEAQLTQAESLAPTDLEVARELERGLPAVLDDDARREAVGIGADVAARGGDVVPGGVAVDAGRAGD